VCYACSSISFNAPATSETGPRKLAVPTRVTCEA
jgi:hypothetical protein